MGPFVPDYSSINIARNKRTGQEISAELSPDTNADRRKWPIEADILAMCRIDAAVHRTEEEIGAIADAGFGVGNIQRETGKRASIWNDYRSSARMVDWRIHIMACWIS